MTYAQAVTNFNKQHNAQENKDVNQTLEPILYKFMAFDKRIKRVEYSAQGATPKIKQK